MNAREEIEKRTHDSNSRYTVRQSSNMAAIAPAGERNRPSPDRLDQSEHHHWNSSSSSAHHIYPRGNGTLDVDRAASINWPNRIVGRQLYHQTGRQQFPLSHSSDHRYSTSSLSAFQFPRPSKFGGGGGSHYAGSSVLGRIPYRHDKAVRSTVRLHNKIRDDRILETAFIHSIAGAGGAILALIIVYPLDTLRARLQCSRQKLSTTRSTLMFCERMLRREGVKALYSGLHSALLGVAVSWTVYYYLYTLLRHKLKAWREHRYSSVENLVVSLVAGVAAAIVSNPIWVVNTRMKLRQEGCDKSFLSQLWEIVQQEGIGHLFAGLSPSLILLLNPATQFTIYEKLKSILKSRQKALQSRQIISFTNAVGTLDPRTGYMMGAQSPFSLVTSRHQAQLNSASVQGKLSVTPLKGFPNPRLTKKGGPKVRLSPTAHFVSGSISKLVALLLTYPFQVIKARAHIKSTPSRESTLDDIDGDRMKRGEEGGRSEIGAAMKGSMQLMQEGSIQSLCRIIETEGFGGLYRGLGSKLIASTLTAAIMFMTYEQLAVFLLDCRSFIRRRAATGHTVGGAAGLKKVSDEDLAPSPFWPTKGDWRMDDESPLSSNQRTG